MERLMPILLFSLPWFMAVYEIYKGLTKGEMREYLRRDYSEIDNGRPAKYCRRDEEPKTFWCLFAFYVAICILVPIGMVYALTRPTDDPATNPGRDHQQQSPTSASEAIQPTRPRGTNSRLPEIREPDASAFRLITIKPELPSSVHQ